MESKIECTSGRQAHQSLAGFLCRQPVCSHVGLVNVSSGFPEKDNFERQLLKTKKEEELWYGLGSKERHSKRYEGRQGSGRRRKYCWRAELSAAQHARDSPSLGYRLPACCERRDL
jgi:hypothetical protein